MDIIRYIFFNFTISSRKSKNQQKLAKKDHTFYNTVLLKKPHPFLTHLTLKIIYSQSTAKSLSDFTNFPANMFLCGVRKNICTRPFCEAQELHSWSTLKANVCIFLYISLKKFCFRDIVRFYLIGVEGGGRDGGRLKKFLMAVRCLGLAKCFPFFYFNRNFWQLL